MRRLFCLVGVIVAGTPALAAEPIVEACKQAAAFYFNVTGVRESSVQAFPDLKPPRVRMKAAIGPPVTDRIAALLATQEVRCRFQQNNAPFRLTQFCARTGCIDKGERFEELQVLMRRAGY